MNLTEPRGVTVRIAGSEVNERYEGAAVLRRRPHPVNGEPSLQLGVPDDALGFRPRATGSYEILIEQSDGSMHAHGCQGVWLERVQTSWWFILATMGDA